MKSFTTIDKESEKYNLSTTPKSTSVATDTPEFIKVMHQARAKTDEFMEDFQESGRADEIDKLENEILKNYINSKEIHLSTQADPISIQRVLSNSQNFLSRVSEIYAGASMKVSKLIAAKNMLQNALLPLVTGGSADARTARVNDITQGLCYMIELEEGLMSICDLSMKNLKNAQDMASRTLKAIELDLVHFNGSDALAKIVQKSRNRYGDED